MQQNSQRMFSANDSPAEEYLQGILPTLTEFEFELDFQVLKIGKISFVCNLYSPQRELANENVESSNSSNCLSCSCSSLPFLPRWQLFPGTAGHFIKEWDREQARARNFSLFRAPISPDIASF